MRVTGKNKVKSYTDLFAALQTIETLARERREALANLTETQARCTALTEEVRKLKNHLTLLGLPLPKGM